MNAFASVALVTILTGLCSPGEKQYSREILEHEGDIDVTIDEKGHYPWSDLEFNMPVYRATVAGENDQVLVFAQCDEEIDCVLGIDVQSCSVCYMDEPEETCWSSLDDSGQGDIDCTGRYEFDESEEGDKYSGEFTLEIETADGEITTLVYMQTYIEPQQSCAY